MDELESAVLLCLNPTADKNLRDQALLYCQNLRQSHDGWAYVLQRLSISMRPEVSFWCLQVIHEALSDSSRYPSGFSADQVTAIRSKVSEYFSQVVSSQSLQNGTASSAQQFPSFLLNKLAQIIASLIAADYPQTWPQAFQDVVMPLVSPQQSTDTSISMFFRLLRSLDEDVTSIRASQLSDTARKRSIQVKDAMRDDCIADIIARCAELISSPRYVSRAFDIVARYVEWVDIGLIVQDKIISPMYAFITSASPNGARPAASVALRWILMKRMDSVAKMSLMTGLRIEMLLQSIPAEQICAIDEEYGDSELNLQTGQVEVAALVNTIAVIALEILKDTLKPNKVSENTAGLPSAAGKIAQVALPVALRFLHEDADEGTSSQTLQCVTTYVNVFSRASKVNKNGTNSPDIAPMIAILNVVEERALFAPSFNPQDDTSDEQRAFFELRRVLLKNIFASVVRTFPEMCLEFISGMFAKATSTKDVPRTELALAMLIVVMTAKSDAPGFDELRIKVITNPPGFMEFSVDAVDARTDQKQTALQHQLERVSTTYFDLVSRSYRLFLTRTNTPLLSAVLPVFVNGRGLGHSSEVVRSHAAYTLLKFTRPLRGIIANSHLDAILNAVKRYMFPLQMNVNEQPSKDQMMVFETVGYLLGSDHRNEGSKQYLSAALQPLIEGLQSSSGMQAIPYIMAAGFLSKGFGGDSKPLLLLNESHQDRSPGSSTKSSGNGESANRDIKIQKITPLAQDLQLVWVNCLEAVLKASAPCLVGQSDSKTDELRYKLLFFLHRMVDTIGVAVLPYLEQVLPTLLSLSSSAVEVRDVIILLSQAVTKFGEASESMAMGIYGALVSRAHQHKYQLDVTTLTAISEESREAVEMHRAYTYFIHAIVGTKLINVLIHPNHQGLLQGVMASMLSSAVGESLDLRVSASVMKMSVHTLTQMVEQWTELKADGTITNKGPPGFPEFALKEITNAIFLSGVRGTVFRSGDYGSAEASSVLMEIVTAQRACAKHLGRAFAEVIQNGPLASLPDDKVSEYVSALYSSDITLSSLVQAFATLLKMLRKL